MERVRTVEAEFLLDITDVIGDRNLVTLSATASPLTSITFFTLSNPLDYRSGSFPERTAAKPNHFRVHQWTPEWQSETDLEETHRNYHFAEPVGKDAWLLVCGRAADDTEHNALLYDSNGKCINSFPVGDAVQDVQVAGNGSLIWVSYFDEGIGGIFGTEGLMAFRPDGTPALGFRSDSINKTPHALPSIFCCYAVNAALDGDVWLYYNPDFPLVRLHDRQIKAIWTDIPVRGSHAFAVTEDRVLFSGGYNETDHLHLVSLYPDASKSETIIPVDADGNPITSPRVLFARGSRLYLLQGDDLFVLDLNFHL